MQASVKFCFLVYLLRSIYIFAFQTEHKDCLQCFLVPIKLIIFIATLDVSRVTGWVWKRNIKLTFLMASWVWIHPLMILIVALMDKKYLNKEMLTSGKSCAKNYQLCPMEIFIGFKKSKNLNLVSECTCRETFMYVVVFQENLTADHVP